MADITKINNGVNINYLGRTYLFPLSAIILAAEEDSTMVNVQLKGNSRTIIAIPNEELEEHQNTAIDTVKTLMNNIY